MEFDNGRRNFLLLLLLLALLMIQSETSLSLTLRTDSRWIVDEKSGWRVKLACVNWPSHLEPVLAEGLSKQPVGVIASKIRAMGFNCVRLTWPLYLATNDSSLASLTVRDSFLRLGLSDSLSGLQRNNPEILDSSLIDAFQAVVNVLGDNKLMVILDNHLTKPGWCCSYSDGNGFFGDEYLDPKLWIQGLTKMATLFRSTTTPVIGMSLRNELRGARQNVDDWYKYMEMGAEAVHAANPRVLVILSGLSYDTDLSFLHTRPLNLSFTGKLVLEAHWYSFSDEEAWKTGNLNKVCGDVRSSVMRRYGYLLLEEQEGGGCPLILSEFGLNLQQQGDISGHRYLGCFLSMAAELDFDWAIWVLAGSYYLRQGVAGMDEFYGLLDREWNEERNHTFLHKISFIQSPLRGPGYPLQKVIFHPTTGLCVLRRTDPEKQQLELGPCSKSEAWSYTPQKRLTTVVVNGAKTLLCLQASGVDKPANLTLKCQGSGTTWEPTSDSKLQLSTHLILPNRTQQLCLDADFDNSIITTSCKCLGGNPQNYDACDPEGQWFKIVETTTAKLITRTASSSWATSLTTDHHQNLAFA